MIRKISILIILLYGLAYGQYNLNYFLKNAEENSPVIKNYNNYYLINELQWKLNKAQNSAFQVNVTGNYLFAPYFNNNGKFISTNPGPHAYGYDVGITNGGLYSALINVDKNIFNGPVLDALETQRNILGKSYRNKIDEEKHSLDKQVADQYFNTLQNLLLFKLSRDVTANLQNQLKITGDMVSKGYAKTRDYLLLKIEYKTQQINLNESWQNYKSGLSQLYSICGIRDTQTVMIDSTGLSIKELKEPESKFLQQFKLDSLNADIQQKIFETKYLPQVKLYFNTGLNAVEIPNIQHKFGLSAGVDFSIPILDGNQKDLTRQQTMLSEESLSDYKNYLAKNIYLRKSISLDKIKSIGKNIADLKEQITDYKNLLNISENQLKQGNLSMIEYMTLLKNYIELQKNSITAEINYQLEISNYNYWNW